MNKDEIISRIFSIASFYEDSIERLQHNDAIDKEEHRDMLLDLDALKNVLDFFDTFYDESENF